MAAIIPCFNAARYVGEAIESVLAQTYDNIEVIVVNDGSTDDLGRAIKPFRDRITVIEQPNSGIGAARNRGIAATGAAYVAFLDADDRWHPDKTAKQAAILTAEPHCGLVHTSRILMDSEGRVVRESPLVPGSLPPARGECLGQLVKANSIFVSSVMVRYSMLDDEPFATDLRGVEDWDLWIRLAARTRFACIDEPLTDYRVHATNFSWNKLAMARATVKLMDGVLLREHDPSIRRVATAHRHEYMLEVAHLEYERGNHREARRWFREAAPGLHAADVMRYGATYMPRLLHGAAQTAWRVLRGIRSGA